MGCKKLQPIFRIRVILKTGLYRPDMLYFFRKTIFITNV